ncbi:MAG: serine/threonine protein kinase [Myxococcales bacterium]|nr:serine/threonine protein kinase [Myxococcales bacterium]
MERIGEYLVRRLVGEGGMGKVYEAEERLSHRRVALKVLRPELAKSEEGRRLFLNEMTILAHLDHANVVRCLACTEVDEQLVMALEFLEGKTLRDYLNEHGALPWEEAVHIAVEIASALAAAHRQDPPIVHRDLKPENVMILDDGGVKVMDFGIAKVLQALSRTTTHSVGTLQYMSPEQIDATGVDARSDLYCLGLVLYELLSGKPPFESPSPRELLNMQCTQAPPPLGDGVRGALPKGIERLLFELLEKRPDDRPGSAADVLHELEPFAPASGGARRRSRTDQPTASSEVSAKSAGSNANGDKPATGAKGSSEKASGADKAAAAPEKKARADTIALVEKAAAPRDIPARTGLIIVVLLSLIAGILTYMVRGAESGTEPGDKPALTASPGFEERR